MFYRDARRMALKRTHPDLEVSLIFDKISA
ncbi:hypothetical protein OESDEN_07992 [Oesophagostomum dentatum]|uniref:Uncharacterized protein n=1 Tax=Oesophagostomum dentatum TaxID=61180 RepID=A0A0B1T8N7_OESDE|nr:hypothetical protein OESDEN_07992 [Oesophagostomum dentatum]